jgi:uncharacterized DUF497 family protein
METEWDPAKARLNSRKHGVFSPTLWLLSKTTPRERRRYEEANEV